MSDEMKQLTESFDFFELVALRRAIRKTTDTYDRNRLRDLYRRQERIISGLYKVSRPAIHVAVKEHL